MQAVLLLIVIARLVSGIDWGALSVRREKSSSVRSRCLRRCTGSARSGVTPEATLASRAWFLFGQIAIGGTVFVAVRAHARRRRTRSGLADDRCQVRAEPREPAGEPRCADRIS